MTVRRVRCPGCATILQVPTERMGGRVRCSTCQSVFRAPSISEGEVLDWLGTSRKEETHADEPALETETQMELQQVAVQAPPQSREFTAVERQRLAKHLQDGWQGREGLLLRTVDQHEGATFELSPELLADPIIRTAMPRCCMRCGTSSQLQVHFLIFGNDFADSAMLESRYLPNRPHFQEQEIAELSQEDLLARLPSAEQLTAPYTHVIPFWICDMCSPMNLIFAQGTDDMARLQIRRLWRAEEFLVNAGGEDSDAHQMVREGVAKYSETSWDMLPGMVQQRVQQWFQPGKEETFLAFVPDRRRMRREAGMAGIVVSNRRLIYHTSMRHREADKRDPLRLSFAMQAGRLTLYMSAPAWDTERMLVDKAGLERLRRVLHEEEYRVSWQ